MLEPETLLRQLEFNVLCSLSNRHAEDWWELIYAHMPYPKARMASQRASEALADLGCENLTVHTSEAVVRAVARLVGYMGDLGRRRARDTR